MISKETSIKNIVVVAVFPFQLKLSHFVKSESQVSLISYIIQHVFWLKTKFRYFVITKTWSQRRLPSKLLFQLQSCHFSSNSRNLQIGKPAPSNSKHYPAKNFIWNQVKTIRKSRDMILKETSFKTPSVVAVLLFQFKISQFVKSESQVSLISYTIQQIIRFKTNLR